MSRPESIVNRRARAAWALGAENGARRADAATLDPKKLAEVEKAISQLSPEEAEHFIQLIERSLKQDPEIRYTFHEREEYTLRDKALYLMPSRDFDNLLEAGRIILNNGKTSMIDLGLETEKDRQHQARQDGCARG